jgi:predicted Zn-dependent protease with MMP-like domain
MARPRLKFREFVREARRALEELPAEFRDKLVNIVIDVQEEPSRRDFRDFPEGDDLLGLFEGQSQIDLEEGIPTQRRIRLFKGPIERASRHRDEVILHVQETMVHEVAHYFGFSEEDLDAFEAAMEERRQRLFGHLDERPVDKNESKAGENEGRDAEGRD